MGQFPLISRKKKATDDPRESLIQTVWIQPWR